MSGKFITPSLCERWLKIVDWRHDEHGEAWDVLDVEDFASIIFMKASRARNQARSGNLRGLMETLCDLHNYVVKIGQKLEEEKGDAK